jgi:hypothetical protein
MISEPAKVTVKIIKSCKPTIAGIDEFFDDRKRTIFEVFIHRLMN